MLQNHPPAVYHRNIKLGVSNNPNANDVPQSMGFDSNLNLAPMKKSGPANLTLRKCPYFVGPKPKSSHWWIIRTHSHTHTQIRRPQSGHRTAQRSSEPTGLRSSKSPSHVRNKTNKQTKKKTVPARQPRLCCSVSTGGTASFDKRAVNWTEKPL